MTPFTVGMKRLERLAAGLMKIHEAGKRYDQSAFTFCGSP